MLKIRIIALVAITLTAALATGCGSEEKSSTGAQAPAETSPGSRGNEPQSLFAEGWSDLIINANFAKTRVDHIAHFTTSRNACGRDAYGALDLPLWNKLAAAMNAALQAPALAEPRCQTVENPGKMDGTAEAQLTPTSKRLLFEVRGYAEVCTTIRDAAAAKSLLEAITAVVLAADREDCSLVTG
ncbi:MAG: hypothetical protein NDJ90_05825 [Oligoflexia bacterium]|nr:hypothetical protein [Oligoflexia bacterium]